MVTMILYFSERQGPERFFDRGVLTCTVRRKIADNAVFLGESAVSNPAIADLGIDL